MVIGAPSLSGGSAGPVVSTTNTNLDTTNANNELTSNNSVFTPGQQAVQGQAGNFISNILSGGQVPQSFGMPQSVYDAAFANFNKYQAPMLAAQNGAGSPAINSSMQELQLQLAGMAGKQSMGNALDAFSQAANFAFKPIGSTGTRAATGTENQTGSGITTTTDVGGLLGGIAFSTGGGFQSIFGNGGGTI